MEKCFERLNPCFLPETSGLEEIGVIFVLQ